ncbi:MAG: lipolytic protein family [Ferruginibacter sp.]|nr:lipolytic protein family [Ferruginibacter sp.]
MRTYSYLALGDSYTVGEQVSLVKAFPYQTIQLLRRAGLKFYAPEIIATTGWTTDELKLAIEESVLLSSYDFVSVLIGVNNQYQGRSVEEFRTHFRVILEFAIQRVGGMADKVIVLSIPDYGVTPFAVNKSPEIIRTEIEMYNFICQTEAEYFQTRYIDITSSQQQDGNKEEFLAPDLLHPSAKEYEKWASLLSSEMLDAIQNPV